MFLISESKAQFSSWKVNSESICVGGQENKENFHLSLVFFVEIYHST